jgi:hypothetical protein
MPRFVVIADDAQLFDVADLTAAHSPIKKNSVVEGDFVTAGGVWLNVRVVSTPDGPSQQAGFMREATLRPDADQPPEPVLDSEEFCALVDNVARTRGVDRDYLMAVAWAGTAGLTQLGSAMSSKVGPFQLHPGNVEPGNRGPASERPPFDADRTAPLAPSGRDGASIDLAAQRSPQCGSWEAADAWPALLWSYLWSRCRHLAARRRSEPFVQG